MIIVLCVCFFILISNSKFFLPLVRDGVSIWYHQLLPALFPAMIFTNLLASYPRSNFQFMPVSKLKSIIMQLFGVSDEGLYVIILGFLGGFPIGAFLTGRLVHENRITSSEGQHLLGFCNNIGPAYYFGVVIPALYQEFNTPKLFLTVYSFIFYLIPLIDGIISARFHAPCITYSAKSPETLKSFPVLLDQSIRDSIQAIVRLAGYLIFFRLFLIIPHFLSLRGPIRLALLCLIEITTGITAWQSSPIIPGQFLLPFLSFGGLSCFAQTYCMIRQTNLSLMKYFLCKIRQSTIFAIILLILSHI